MNAHNERLLELCEAVSAGSADESQVLELQELMQHDEAARLTFLEWCDLQSDISEAISSSKARVALGEEFDRSLGEPRAILRWSRLLAIAATLLIGFFALSYYQSGEVASLGDSDPQEENTKLALDGMAVLTRTESVVWSNAEEERAVGDLLKSDSWIEIDSGVAEIEFGQGAVVVLEGPARFVAKSTSVGLLQHGKLAAVVPPWAEGFRVDTSTIEVVDRGTQFVLEVTPDQQVSVGVTKGEVEVKPQKKTREFEHSSEQHRILAGSSIRALGSQISKTSLNEQWSSLSSKLPLRPDHTQVDVVAKYRRDFVQGVANEPRRSGAWRYYANAFSQLRDKSSYRELLWDSRRAVYDPNGDRGWNAGKFLNAANFSYRGGHPGQGRDQTPASSDHYVIAAYQVSKPGRHRIESGWLVRAESRADLENQSVDLRVWVNQGKDVIARQCKRNGLLQFGGDLGRLEEGDWVYVAIGPQGVSYNDRFEWDFAIVRTIEGVSL